MSQHPSHARYRQLVELAGDAIVVVDQRGGIVEVNEQACSLFGYPGDKMLGTPVMGLVEPAHLAANPLRFDLVLAGETLVKQRTLLRSDGSTFAGELNIKAMPDGTVLGIIRDISARVDAERALQDSEQRFRQVIAQSPLATSLYRADGTLLETNRASDELWNVTPELKAQLRTSYNILEDAQLVDKGVMPFIRRGFQGEWVEVPAVEYDPERSPTLRGNKMREFWVRGYVYPVRDAEGAVDLVVLVHEDVSLARAEEKEKAALQEKMQAAQRLESLGVLAGGIAHDFNNLLTSILGNASLAGLRLGPESPAAESLRAIETSSHRAAELCQQLLAYAGQGRLTMKPVDLTELLDDMTSILAVSISKKATLEHDLSQKLPAVQADSTQLRQVIMNLLTNASEALEDGPGAISVRTGVATCDEARLARTLLGDGLSPGTYVFLEVRDTGAGMSEETAARMFEPFFTTRFTGRGLGLAAVLGILKSHGGTLEVDTRLGVGTTMRLLLPVIDAPPAQGTAFESATPSAEAVSGLALVVDDEQTVGRVAARCLELGGYDVITASDGHEGQALFEQHKDRLELLLIDLTMPGQSGIALLEHIRSAGSDVPAILSSGYTPPTESMGPALQPFRFLGKPYRLDDLLTIAGELRGQA